MADSGSSVEGTPHPEDDESARLEARLLRWDAAARRTEEKLARARAALARARAASERLKSAQAREGRWNERQQGIDRAKTDEGKHATDRREAMADQPGRSSDRGETDADERDRIAHERKTDADERDRTADRREDQADEREQAAREEEATLARREGWLDQWENAVSRSDSASQRAADEREARLDVRERRLRQEEAEFDERKRLAEQAELTREMDRSAEMLRGISGGVTGQGSSSWASLAERAAALRARAAGLPDRMADQAEQFAAYLYNATTPGDRERRHRVADTELEIARIERHNAAKLRDRDHPFHLDEHLPKLPDTDPTSESDPGGDAPGAAG